MEKQKISAKIVADSISNGSRITTFLLVFPRFILAELNTHRMFSRNSASSRAIPFNKMAKSVKEDPFIPVAWQRGHKGMQGTEYWKKEEAIVGKRGVCTSYPKAIAESEWLNARDAAVTHAEQMHSSAKITKQLCNRLLEPFMWHTALVTATDFETFFKLRCPVYPPLSELRSGGYEIEDIHTRSEWLDIHRAVLDEEPKISTTRNGEVIEILAADATDQEWMEYSNSGAEIHMKLLAEAMKEALDINYPEKLKPGEWHIPFGNQMNWDDVCDFISEKSGKDHFPDTYVQRIKLMVSAARCARLSYRTFDGEIDFEKDVSLSGRLLAQKHMSPFEHIARAMDSKEFVAFRKGKHGVDFIENGETGSFYVDEDTGDPGWCNNLKGYIPLRYLLEQNEIIFI